MVMRKTGGEGGIRTHGGLTYAAVFKYVPFSFKDDRGTRTSHHLIFAGKHVRGYEIMKDVMAGFSTKEQGVPSFEYNPADERYPALFEYSRPLDDLSEMLLKEFAGRCLPMHQIYEEHNIGRRYVEKNYKLVIYTLLYHPVCQLGIT